VIKKQIGYQKQKSQPGFLEATKLETTNAAGIPKAIFCGPFLFIRYFVARTAS
jgi:hypothetical protein